MLLDEGAPLVLLTMGADDGEGVFDTCGDELLDGLLADVVGDAEPDGEANTGVSDVGEDGVADSSGDELLDTFGETPPVSCAASVALGPGLIIGLELLATGDGVALGELPPLGKQDDSEINRMDIIRMTKSLFNILIINHSILHKFLLYHNTTCFEIN